jgi:subtilisin family serine protease
VVLIGHDLTSVTRQATIPRMLGNAVFLARAAPRVLILNQFTDPASVAGLSVALGLATTDVAGRSLPTVIAADPTSTTTLFPQLQESDVFIINVQQGASDLTLETWGQDWSFGLNQFLFRGGVIVVFDGGRSDANQGTFQILEEARIRRQPNPPAFEFTSLMPVTARTALSQRQLDVEGNADVIASRMSTTYPSEGETVGFVLAPAVPNGQDPAVVVRAPIVAPEAAALPVVLHNTFTDNVVVQPL